MGSSLFADRYRLEEVLSTTAMADVRTATDVTLDRRVVVKLLALEADRSRFEREAQAAAALAHPNIVQVFDYGEAEDRPYIVFEYLPGGSLEARLVPERPLPDDETVRIAADIAAGLAHAHRRGVVHRDLKPGNVLFDVEERAKIADFGIAQLAGAVTLTDAGTVLGTATYISPEQTRGETATPASDVYSFGVVLYRMLSGRLPFESESPVELAAMHRDANPSDVRDIRPDVPPALAAIAMAALAKAPTARPRDGEALVRALATEELPLGIDAPTQQLSAQTDAVTRVIPTAPPPRRRRRLSLLLAGVIAAALLAGGVLAAVFLTNGSSPAPTVSLTTSRSTSATRQTTAPRTSVSTATSSQATTTSPRPTTATSPSPVPSPSTTRSTSTAATTTTPTTTAPTTTSVTTTSETTTTTSTAPGSP